MTPLMESDEDARFNEDGLVTSEKAAEPVPPSMKEEHIASRGRETDSNLIFQLLYRRLIVHMVRLAQG